MTGVLDEPYSQLSPLREVAVQACQSSYTGTPMIPGQMKLTPEVKVTKKRDPLAILQIFDRFFTPRPSLWFSFPKHWIFFGYLKCLTKVLNFGVTVEILVYNKVHV